MIAPKSLSLNVVISTEVLDIFFFFSANCKTEVNRLKTESLALEPIEIAPGIEVIPTPIMSQADQKVENALTENDCTQRLVWPQLWSLKEQN